MFKQLRPKELHIAVIHGGIKSFRCKICNSNFGWKKNLHKHMKIKHETKIKTDLVEKTLQSKNDVKIHSAKIPDKSKLFICNDCGKGFTLKHNLIKHVGKCNKQTFSCDNCSKSYSYKSNLSRHIKEGCVKGGSDNNCEKHYKKKSKVAKKETKPTLEFKCSICESLFESSSKYRSHVEALHKDMTIKGFITEGTKIPSNEEFCEKLNNVQTHVETVQEDMTIEEFITLGTKSYSDEEPNKTNNVIQSDLKSKNRDRNHLETAYEDMTIEGFIKKGIKASSNDKPNKTYYVQSGLKRQNQDQIAYFNHLEFKEKQKKLELGQKMEEKVVGKPQAEIDYQNYLHFKAKQKQFESKESI